MLLDLLQPGRLAEPQYSAKISAFRAGSARCFSKALTFASHQSTTHGPAISWALFQLPPIITDLRTTSGRDSTALAPEHVAPRTRFFGRGSYYPYNKINSLALYKPLLGLDSEYFLARGANIMLSSAFSARQDLLLASESLCRFGADPADNVQPLSNSRRMYHAIRNLNVGRFVPS